MATIRRRKDKWQVQVRRLGYKPLSQSFLNRRDAEAWARQTEVRLDRCEIVCPTRDRARITLADLLFRYECEVSPQKRGSSVECIRLRTMRQSCLAALSLRELSASHFATYRDQRLSKVSAATVRREFTILRHVLRVATREWGHPLSRELVDIRLPPSPPGRDRRMSVAEAGAFFAALEQINSVAALASRFAIATGLRRGELLRMRWPQIDLEKRLLKVSETKTGVPRTIPLSRAAAGVLSKVPRGQSSDLTFCITASALRGAWDRAKQQARVSDLHFHDLRHEAISRFFEAGLSVPEVALISGHRDFRMLARYTHLRPMHILNRLDQLGVD